MMKDTLIYVTIRYVHSSSRGTYLIDHRALDHPKLQERSLLLTDAGALFNSSGMRISFMIANERITAGVRSIN